jgi:NB-ARC domain-containing protein
MPLDQETINQQLILLAAHRRTLAHLLRQAAQYGGEVFAPAQTATGIAEARAEIRKIKAILRKNGVRVDEEPGDKAPRRRKPAQAQQAGDVISGDKVGGDKVGSDKVMGDKRIINTEGGNYAEGNIDKRQGDVFVEGNVYGNVIGVQNIFNQPSPAPALRAGSAPPIPALIVGREDALHALKARLGISRSMAPSPLQVLTAVRGWPGVGKTTLAAALAHDPEIAAAFPDGILWASLGQDAHTLSHLAAWGRAFGIDDLIRGSIEETSARLTALLRDKRVLLIVDDVWEAAHAVPFKVGGRGCALLITTRLTGVADALAPTPDAIYKLAVLTDDKALELLQALAPHVVRQHPAACRELVRELEGLPLALQVAGHMLRVEAGYGFGVTALLDELREGAKLLMATAPADRSDLAKETTPTVAVLLQKSTDRLDPFTRDCFAYLGAFVPKPATFDLAALQAVWMVETDAAQTVARTLVDRGLLEPIGNGRFWVDGLLVMHARSLLISERDQA